MMKSIAQINEKIKKGKAVVVTAEEIIEIAEEKGYKEAAEYVDVVTTGTFGPMCSSGVFINFGHSSPPIRMTRIELNDVPAYGGLAAVDTYIGATEVSTKRGMEYGGGHVIEDLIAGKDIKLYATSNGTDCYPRKEILTSINKDNINQAYMYNPRNAYQNYPAAINSTNKTIYTYMGTLLPNYGNITYSTSGELSPLINDPYLRTIGVGTRIFLGGAIGYVAWEGTQHKVEVERSENGVPVVNAATLAVIGDIKGMSTRYIRGAVFEKYGVTLFVGIGIPIPILDEEMLRYTAVRNRDIYTRLVDKSGTVQIDKKYSYEELRSGSVKFNGKTVPTAPLSSLAVARDIAATLKDWIKNGSFELTEAVIPIPHEENVYKLDIREIK
ncbi:MAG: homocysteine biosynthesis protein [Clostridia bacterium]